MSSWVRYSVAVYIGLLVSGTVVHPPWEPTGRESAHPHVLPEAAVPIQSPGLPEVLGETDEHEAAAIENRSATLTA